MALDVWPAGLPYRPQVDGTEVSELFVPPKESEVEDGPTIMREWSSSNWSVLQYRLLLTHAQYDTFDNFVRNTLARGRKRFLIPAGKFGASSWTNKTAYIKAGSIKGPRKSGEGHVVVDFILHVNGWQS